MILVFGSINADLVLPVPHLPQPGETVLGGDYAVLPGGKGANQALAARRAGAQVMLAGAVGEDAFATVALDGLARSGVDLALVRRVARPTGCALIMVGGAGENLIALAPGANREAAAAAVPDALLGPATLVVAQGEVPAGETAALVRRARARGARSLVNLAPFSAALAAFFDEIDLVVANAGEAAALSDDPATIGRRLRRGLVVTQGAAGAAAFLADGSRLAVPALAIDPVDTTGAGDTFVGVLAAGLDPGLDHPPGLAAALRRASAAAGLACLAQGAQSAIPGEAAIAAALRRLPPE